MNGKAYLERAARLDMSIQTKLEQVEQFRSLAYKITSVIRADSGVSGSTPKSALEDSVIKLCMAEQELDRQIDRFVDAKREIEGLLEHMEIDEERTLLEWRYLCLKSWEDIANAMHFSKSYAYQLHRRALESFETILRTKLPAIESV